MTYVKYFLIVLTLLIQTVSAQSVDNPKITYFHNDITGTPIAASDEEGNIIWREERRAYGEIKVDPLKPKTLEEFSVGFTGHQADRESGLTYAKARYYNPNIGRFYAPDPIPFRQSDLTSFNRYVYAGNNPYRFFDPMGTDKWLITQKYDNTISNAEAKIIAGAIGIVLTPVAVLEAYHKDGLNAGMVVDAIPYGALLHKAKKVVTTATKPASEVGKPFKAVKKANPCSFKADTLVATPQGLKPIAELNEGDYVMSRDELTGQVSAKQITHKFVEQHDDDVRELTVSNGLIETVIITSDEHPFYVLGKGFIPASELKASDQLVSLDFNVLKVIRNKRIDESMLMYNFEVADYHTYAVSEQNVWVHNDCLEDLQSTFGNLADKHLLPNFQKIDPNLRSGYTGSFKTGKVGNPSKDTFGQDIDLNNFDIDFWIKSDILHKRYGNSLKADVGFREILSNTPGFEGLKPNKKGFSIKFLPND